MNELKLNLPSEVTPEEAKLLLAMKLYEIQKISIEKASEIAGHSQQAFLKLLKKYNISNSSYTKQDLKEFFKKVNASYQKLHDHRKEWKEELKKRKLFENTLMDGLKSGE